MSDGSNLPLCFSHGSLPIEVQMRGWLSGLVRGKFPAAVQMKFFSQGVDIPGGQF